VGVARRGEYLVRDRAATQSSDLAKVKKKERALWEGGVSTNPSELQADAIETGNKHDVSLCSNQGGCGERAREGRKLRECKMAGPATVIKTCPAVSHCGYWKT